MEGALSDETDGELWNAKRGKRLNGEKENEGG